MRKSTTLSTKSVISDHSQLNQHAHGAIDGQSMAGRAETGAIEAAAPSIAVELIAVLVAVADGRPLAMTIDGGRALPSGPFAVGHRSLQSGLRAWVERQTHHPLGYVEQLYTFAGQLPGSARGISISYLGLSRQAVAEYPGAEWHSWYEYFPWEDARQGKAARHVAAILPRLHAWAGANAARQARVAGLFGAQGWNEELVLQRYELLWEAGLVPEARRARPGDGAPVPGKEMVHDH